MTHEDKHSFGISRAFPTFDHIRILFNSLIEVHGEQGSRTIGKVGPSLRGLILPARCSICGVNYRGCSQCEAEEVVILVTFRTCTQLSSTKSSRVCGLGHRGRWCWILEGRRVQSNFSYKRFQDKGESKHPALAWYGTFRLALRTRLHSHGGNTLFQRDGIRAFFQYFPVLRRGCITALP